TAFAVQHRMSQDSQRTCSLKNLRARQPRLPPGRLHPYILGYVVSTIYSPNKSLEKFGNPSFSLAVNFA
ncbi:MAG: hypothetical protein ACLQJL_18800, partial [Roseiarcus sp.]